MRLLLATRNAHKLREFARLLAPAIERRAAARRRRAAARGRRDLRRERARQGARRRGGDRPAAIADDSGIEAAALGGAPGVRSARYAGEHASDEENLAKLLREAPAGQPRSPTSARSPTSTRRRRRATCSRGAARARSRPQPRGDGGFGYDPAFLPDDDRATAARWPSCADDEKDAISHRGRAVRALLGLAAAADAMAAPARSTQRRTTPRKRRAAGALDRLER